MIQKQVVRKFTDEELLEEYEKGVSDNQIAKKFHVHHRSIWIRRCKLGLVANFPSFSGKILTKKELKERRKNELQRGFKRWRQKYPEKLREYYHRPEVKKKMREYMREYYHRPEVRAKQKEYSQKPEIKKKIRKYQRKYYKKNKEVKIKNE